MTKEDQVTQQMMPIVTKIFGFNYHIDKIIAITRTSVAFKVYNIKDKANGVLWISQFTLAEGEEANFSKRMVALEKLTFSPQAKSYGLDGDLRPYLVQTYVGLHQLGVMGAGQIDQALVYIEDMVRAVAQVHYLGYELGDLSLSSFIVDGDGRLTYDDFEKIMLKKTFQ